MRPPVPITSAPHSDLIRPGIPGLSAQPFLGLFLAFAVEALVMAGYFVRSFERWDPYEEAPMRKIREPYGLVVARR